MTMSRGLESQTRRRWRLGSQLLVAHIPSLPERLHGSPRTRPPSSTLTHGPPPLSPDINPFFSSLCKHTHNALESRLAPNSKNLPPSTVSWISFSCYVVPARVDASYTLISWPVTYSRPGTVVTHPRSRGTVPDIGRETR